MPPFTPEGRPILSEVTVLFPDGPPRRAPDTAPDRYFVDQRVRCRLTGRTGTVILVRDQAVFTLRLDPCRAPLPGGAAGETVELPAVDICRTALNLEPLHPSLDPQVLVYIRPRRPGPGQCLVRRDDGTHAWVGEEER